MTISRSAARLAFRNRALTLSVCATTGVDLAATAAGYTRSSGSFVTENYQVGQEVAPTGFTQTTPGIIEKVEAGLLTIDGGRTVQTSGSGRSLAVGLPTSRSWELVRNTPPGNRWYVEEKFVQGGGGRLLTMPAQGGLKELTGLYILTLYGIPEVGTDGFEDVVDGLLALFTAGTTLTAGTEQLRVREDLEAYPGEIQTIDGRAVVPITIPWRVHTRNTIAA